MLFLAGLELFVWPQFLQTQIDRHIIEEKKHLGILGTALIHPLRNADLAQIYSILNDVQKKHPHWHRLKLIDQEDIRIYPFSVTNPDIDNSLINIEHHIEFFDTAVGRLNVSIDMAPIQKSHADFIHKIQLLILDLLLASVTVAAFLQERTLILPIRLLSQAAHKLADGNFDAKLIKGGKDEIGNLVDSFQYMRSCVKEYQDQLHKLAHHDPLTGLANRKLGMERLQHGIARSNRNKKLLGMLFVDLDKFKSVNDTLGHATGDALITTVGRTLETIMRENDTVARLGGDEFMVLVEMVDSPVEIELVAQRILDRFHTPIDICDREFQVMLSIGIAVYPDHAKDMNELMKNADTAMYMAKKIKGNSYQFYS